jgi:hypothetical protein
MELAGPEPATSGMPGRPAILENQPGTAERLAVPESSRTNADDGLPLDPLGRVEGADGLVEGCDLADVRP